LDLYEEDAAPRWGAGWNLDKGIRDRGKKFTCPYSSVASDCLASFFVYIAVKNSSGILFGVPNSCG
jgi:hypothetical protein